MKESAPVVALIKREIEGGRFYILTRDCRCDGLEPRWRGRESQTKYTSVLFFSHIGHRKTKTNPSQCRKWHLSVRPSTLPPVSSHFLPNPVGIFQVPDCKRLKKSGKHVDRFTSKGAESKEPDTVSQSEVFSISAGGFQLVVTQIFNQIWEM